MSTYVDIPMWSFGRMKMCHLTADTHAELIAMADRIGVAREWIQHPGEWREHFDICKSKRLLAVRYGAIQLNTVKEAAEHVRQRRAAAPAWQRRQRN